jgi:hypothetical protein
MHGDAVQRFGDSGTAEERKDGGQGDPEHLSFLSGNGSIRAKTIMERAKSDILTLKSFRASRNCQRNTGYLERLNVTGVPEFRGHAFALLF